MRTFEVDVVHEGQWWVFELPELGAAGQATRLAGVEFEARGVASALIKAELHDVAVNVTPVN